MSGLPSIPTPVAELPWKRTIFCQFDWSGKHGALLAALAACAREIDCDLVIKEMKAEMDRRLPRFFKEACG